MAHPAVAEAAVIGVSHPKWDERPLLIVQKKRGAEVTREELLAFYDGKVAKWWVPDDVVFVESAAAHRHRQAAQDPPARGFPRPPPAHRLSRARGPAIGPRLESGEWCPISLSEPAARQDSAAAALAEVLMRHLAIALALTSAALILGGCKVPPENDPHSLTYSLWPSDSPDVVQYSTNPYPSLTAPPLYAPPGGRD